MKQAVARDEDRLYKLTNLGLLHLTSPQETPTYDMDSKDAVWQVGRVELERRRKSGKGKRATENPRHAK